jgi:hypothetical protein
MVFIRLYRFHRRSGMGVRRAAKRALATVLRDLNINTWSR